MWRSVFAFSALTLFGAGLTACSINHFERRDPWRDQAEQVWRVLIDWNVVYEKRTIAARLAKK